MTSSRIVRGTKTRIFLYICIVLFITVVFACYNTTLNQLDEARKSSDNCHQQEENLSQQLQVISEYKQRLEKSLKTEKVEHQQNKNYLENKLKEEKAKYEKDINESNLRFSALQQQFNLLKTEHDDFKEECSKTQKKQLIEINNVKGKLQETQEELKKVITSKENLKSQYLQLQVDKEALQKELKDSADNKGESDNQLSDLKKTNYKLEAELSELKERCPTFPVAPAVQFNSTVGNKLNDLPNPSAQAAPSIEQKVSSSTESSLILKQPSKSTASSTSSSSAKVSQANLEGARPLIVPTVTPKSAVKSSSSSGILPLPYVRLPEGVVPPQKAEAEQNIMEDDMGNSKLINNRYRNKIDNVLPNVALKKEEHDDGAQEVFDPAVQHGLYDQLGFGDEAIKHAEKQNFHRQHIDNLAVGDKAKQYDNNEYNQNDLQVEDPEDDDADYADHLGQNKDAVVRH